LRSPTPLPYPTLCRPPARRPLRTGPFAVLATAAAPGRRRLQLCRPQPVFDPEEPVAVRIAVTGSIATDHLMTFEGRLAEQLIAEDRKSTRLNSSHVKT